MPFSRVYPLHVQKAESKNRTKAEVDQIVLWLTGCDHAGLRKRVKQDVDIEIFFAQVLVIHPNRALLKGVVCGIRVEDIGDPLMPKVRDLDELVDELANGKPMEKILRR